MWVPIFLMTFLQVKRPSKTKKLFICILKHRALQVPQEKNRFFIHKTKLWNLCCVFSKGVALFVVGTLRFLEAQCAFHRALLCFSFVRCAFCKIQPRLQRFSPRVLNYKSGFLHLFPSKLDLIIPSFHLVALILWCKPSFSSMSCFKH